MISQDNKGIESHVNPHNFFYYSFLVQLENVEIEMKNSCKISKDICIESQATSVGGKLPIILLISRF